MTSLQLIHYPHPTLLHRSKPIMRVDDELRQMVQEMFDIMYEFRGVGLAANQVGLPLRLFVANPSGEKDVGPELVFINPVITKGKGTAEAEEGCLSLPGINAPVKRNKSLHINAYNLQGEEIDTDVDGFLARIIQHEIDHLDGVLFIDRLSDEILRPLVEDIYKFQRNFESQQESGMIPSDEAIKAKQEEFEKKYC